MVLLLILAAVIAAAASMLFVSEATFGVWVMAGAIFLVALARIAQASAQHNELRALSREKQHQDVEIQS